MASDKLHPRNRTARRAAITAAGNPVTTELESGVGNCFPGLEFDVRNLDRRFFPYLLVDFVGRAILIAEVDAEKARADGVAPPLLQQLSAIADDPTWTWEITRIDGEFAGFENDDGFLIADLRPDRRGPADGWTAVRLLKPATSVTLTVTADGPSTRTLTAQRASYLRDDGALADMFSPGELTQSLCSPWTHDFRDCGCHYWASNHPDIVQPAVPTPAATDDPAFSGRVPWQRADRITSPPPPPPPNEGRAERRGKEMHYHVINTGWQQLDIVLDGREQRAPYAPASPPGVALPPGRLVPTLRYAAGVELAVTLVYLAALYSLDPAAGAPNSRLREDVTVARYEILRVAQSEMRHLKAVNGLLLEEHQQSGAVAPFQPALGIATVIPAGGGNTLPADAYQPLTPDVLATFIAVEAPSMAVDALYGDVQATYEQSGQETRAAVITQIMAEGADHWATFRIIEELLTLHDPDDYLIDGLTIPAPGDPRLEELQTRYETMLDHFHDGYAVGLPAGRAALLAGRRAMLGTTGVEGACEDLAAARVLPVLAPVSDPRFSPVSPP